MSRLIRFKRKFRFSQVDPTLNCNLQCGMCPWAYMLAGNATMGGSAFKTLTPYFEETDEADLPAGRGPSLHPRLGEMVCMAKDAGCMAGFSTNAALLVPEQADALLEAGIWR